MGEGRVRVENNMLNHRAIAGLLILSASFLGFLFLGWFLDQFFFRLIDFAPVVLKVEQEAHPLTIGRVAYQTLFLSLAFFSLITVNEFFGLKSAFLLLVTGALWLLSLWGIFNTFSIFPFVESSDRLNQIDSYLVDLGLEQTLGLAAALVSAGIVMSLLYHLFRKLTHGSFSLFRLFLSQLIGLPVFAAVIAIFPFLPEIRIGPVLSNGLVRLVQHLSLFFLLIIPFYIAKLFLAGIIGRKHLDEVKSRFMKKSLFRHEEKNFFESREANQEQRI